MRDPLTRKHHRQQALARLVSDREHATQAELVSALRQAGFAATQATVSRDIVELGLVKVARDGHHAYSPPTTPPATGGVERLRRFCEDNPVEASSAGSLIVLRSLPGTADALAAAFDGASFAEAVGTIAGDDTVFVAVKRERDGRALVARLASFGVRRTR